jgi:hypothetical protein
MRAKKIPKEGAVPTITDWIGHEAGGALALSPYKRGSSLLRSSSRSARATPVHGFKDIPLRTISIQQCEDWLIARSARLTLKHELAVLRAIFCYAVDLGAIAKERREAADVLLVTQNATWPQIRALDIEPASGEAAAMTATQSLFSSSSTKCSST